MNRLQAIQEKRVEIGKKAAERWRAREGERLEVSRPTDTSTIRNANNRRAIEDFIERAGVRNVRERALGNIRSSFIERILGTNDLVEEPVSPEERLAGQAVGRIVEIGNGPNDLFGFGTGFLITPCLMITNHHVFETARNTLGCGIQFGYEKVGTGLSAGELFELDADTFFFADEGLDYAVVAVRPKSLTNTNLAKWGHHKLVGQTGKILKGHTVTIIQHPSGGPKKYANTNNMVVDILDEHLHYLTDTEPGSSGSPAFNIEFEVVGLHHCGVADMDGDVILNRQHQPWRREQGDAEINWIANEGVRISKILAHLNAVAFASDEQRALRDSITGIRTDILDAELLNPADGEPFAPVDVRPSSYGAGVSTRKLPSIEAQETDVAGRAVINVAGDAQIYFGTVNQYSRAAPADDRRAGAAETRAHLLERQLKRDPHYAHRRGYDENFLPGFSLPLPEIDGDRLNEIYLDRHGNPHILDYHHFSLVMNKEWMLLMWSAANSDYSPQVRFNYSRDDFGSDKWIEDPRIPGSLQIDDPELYAPAKKFDRGHVVRRDDNAWGATVEEMEYANSDTFHWTNCTPQHEHFNRAIFQYKGIWGKLEQHIAKQARAVGNRVTIFSGPVLDIDRAIPHDFGGGTFNVPLDFWKVVLVGERRDNRRTPKLKAYGFLLEQETTINRNGLEAMRDQERFEIGEFVEQQRSLAELTRITGVKFDDVILRADVMANDAGPRVLERLDGIKN
ncbi:endonuclease G [Rhodobium orientis]|uniref:Serine protease n=1 Tax=Rhodobium orientis TaxID=34017 RepID=A0A327K2I5_9HYPH|nr:DNA/RNA non-specific endonuclease [Rhodobium orientis]MBB4304079.1 endonuclease G [Rhodobium orientis]MBK5950716.1 hypothetical protein [Rhodobium orientis]RAI29608.1 hypothetical protein CH339_02900 [Rhodobium orientis]